MIDPDDLILMTEGEKLDLLRQIAEADDWQECFEPIHRTLMGDSSAPVRREAVAALWDVADPSHIDALIDKAAADPDVEVRAKAASVLGIYVYESVINGALPEAQYLAVRKFLLDTAGDPQENLLVRRMAVEALSFEDEEAVHELIHWAYNHVHPQVKMTAVFAMGRSRSARWHEDIQAELDAEDTELRIEAIHAAGEAGIEAATPKLRNLAASQDKEVRLAAIWALSHTRGPGAIETLEIYLHADDEETRQVARDAVEEFNSARRAESDNDGDYDEMDGFSD